MKITLLLVKRLVELGLDLKHLDVASRDEGIVRAFVLEKMTSGALSYNDYTNLVSQEDESAAAALVSAAQDWPVWRPGNHFLRGKISCGLYPHDRGRLLFLSMDRLVSIRP